MDHEKSEAATHRLVAGVLCLDFANTINGHGNSSGHEYLKNYADIIIWSRRAGLLSDDDAQSLILDTMPSPALAKDIHIRFIFARELIYSIFSAIAHNQLPVQSEIAQLNLFRAEALSQSQILPSENGFKLGWLNPKNPYSMLWPIVLSAAELLTSGNLIRIRQCDGEGCDWLFIDNSRNHLRRWCSMDECGNRAKSQRYLNRLQHHSGKK